MDIKKYLPSKQFSKFLAVALLLGLVIFLVLKLVNIKTSTRQKIQNIATRDVIEELDSDNDGLKDWEEALWGMDFEKADTDDDGILDGQEVEIIRTELKESDGYVEVDEVPDTETEKIARQLLTVALNVNKTSGENLSQDQVNSLAEGFIQSVKPNMISLYSLSDLQISTTKTAQSYYDEMSKELAFLNTIPTNELSIFELAISTKKEEKLKELESIIKIYTSVPEKILDNQIPSEVAEDHLAYINALTQKAIALASMIQYFEDPIIAFRGVQEYGIADDNIVSSSQKITDYFKKNNIVR